MRNLRVAGIDEAGRGPLAGPVVAAAVILKRGRPIAGVADSKVLTAESRAELNLVIRRRALCFGVGWADPAEIDTLNILHATFLAMRRAVLAMACCPDVLLVDGNRLPQLSGLRTTPAPIAVAAAAGPQTACAAQPHDGGSDLGVDLELNLGLRARAIVGGDATEPAISAASILAKTARDAYMRRMHELYPQYAFHSHKGYATAEHRRLLALHGPCALHRRSFTLSGRAFDDAESNQEIEE